MKRLIWLPIAGFLLIAGAAAAAAAPGVADSAKALFSGAQAPVSAAASPAASVDPSGGANDPSTGAGPLLEVNGPGSLLHSVLADLVTQGVITRAQSDAITSALTTKVDARRAELEAQRQQMQQMWTQIQGFLSDGVISADELAQLPADNPFAKLSGILDDGQITLQELQSLGPVGGFPFDGRGGPGGGHHGPGLWFNVNDNDSDSGSGNPAATPSASPSSGSST